MGHVTPRRHVGLRQLTLGLGSAGLSDYTALTVPPPPTTTTTTTTTHSWSARAAERAGRPVQMYRRETSAGSESGRHKR